MPKNTALLEPDINVPGPSGPSEQITSSLPPPDAIPEPETVRAPPPPPSQARPETVADRPREPYTDASLPARSLQLVAAQRGASRIAITLLTVVAVVAACLIFVPWQQTVIGRGDVIIYSAMDRPQSIEAQIPGRLVEWSVQEGAVVKQGDVLARLEDLDSKFLDANQGQRLAQQRAALLVQRARARDRAERFARQLRSLENARNAALATAAQRVSQAKQRDRSASQAVIGAQKSARIASEVARASASERAGQTRDRVRAAEQALEAARQNLETSRLQRERIADLYAKTLRSKRDDELAQNDLVKMETDVARAGLALEVARKDEAVGGLDVNRADLETDRVRTEVERALAARDIAARDITTAALDRARLDADTTAAMSSVGASLESARETVAKIEGDLSKLDVDQQNLARRTGQQDVRAPRSGRIVRLLRVGAGETVKAGDVLAVIAPDTADQAVELYLTDNDIPLVAEGRKVRLQFAGWPALQFSGFPSVSVGTFAGVVSVIDAVDDGTARYRVIVKPDHNAIRAKREQAWPKLAVLRPGAEATGWVMLDTVPVGFELWRQFNAFPATVKQVPVGAKEGKESDKEKKDDKKNDYIKLKYKK